MKRLQEHFDFSLSVFDCTNPGVVRTYFLGEINQDNMTNSGKYQITLASRVAIGVEWITSPDSSDQLYLRHIVTGYGTFASIQVASVQSASAHEVFPSGSWVSWNALAMPLCTRSFPVLVLHRETQVFCQIYNRSDIGIVVSRAYVSKWSSWAIRLCPRCSQQKCTHGCCQSHQNLPLRLEPIR